MGEARADAEYEPMAYRHVCDGVGGKAFEGKVSPDGSIRWTFPGKINAPAGYMVVGLDLELKWCPLCGARFPPRVR